MCPAALCRSEFVCSVKFFGPKLKYGRSAVLCCSRNTSFCSLIRTLAHKKPLGLWVMKDPTDLWVIGQLEWCTGERWLV